MPPPMTTTWPVMLVCASANETLVLISCSKSSPSSLSACANQGAAVAAPSPRAVNNQLRREWNWNAVVMEAFYCCRYWMTLKSCVRV
mgnify:CR=1 FL=1